MRVKCISNSLRSIIDSVTLTRLTRAIQIDGPIADLVVGKDYAVEAVEEREGGIWLFVHSVQASDFPYPYPIELFQFVSNAIPPGWAARFVGNQGNVILKRLAFIEWAEDDVFYEHLVNGDSGILSVYHERRQRKERGTF